MLYRSILSLSMLGGAALGAAQEPTTFARYDSPAFCVAAARVARDRVQQTYEFQTQSYIAFKTLPAGDTSSAVAVRVARACGARFTIDNTPPARLRDLLDLALLQQNDSLATAITKRLIDDGINTAAVLHPSDGKPGRGDALDGLDQFGLVVVRSALDELPRQTKFLEAFSAQLAASSHPHRAFWEMLAQMGLLIDAWSSFDRARMRRAADRIITLSRIAPKDTLFKSLLENLQFDVSSPVPVTWDRSTFGGRGMLESAYIARAAIVAVDAPDSLAALGAAMAANVQALHFGDSVTAAGETGMLSDVVLGKSAGGAAEIQARPDADYWFPAPPTSGHYTLVVSRLGARTAASGPGSEDFGCVASYACLVWPHIWIADWLARYGNRGLDVLMLESTTGAFLEKPVSHDEEAKRLGWFWREHLGLPITVGVLVHPDSAPRPAPDGRIVPAPMVSRTALQYQIPITLLGPKNELLYKGFESPVLDALLEKLLGAPSALASSVKAASVPATPSSASDTDPHISTHHP